MSDVAHEAAASLLAEDQVDVAPVEGEQLETPEESFDFPSYQVDEESLNDVLDGVEEEDDAPLVYSEPEDEEEPSWDDDDEKRKLKSELVKLQKKVAWESEQRVKSQSKEWREKFRVKYPLADVDEIEATSRRSFEKQAAAQQLRYQKKLQPFTDALETLKRQALAEVQQEERARAEQAWGRPTSGPSAPVVESSQEDAALARGNFRTLQDRTLALIKAGKLQI